MCPMNQGKSFGVRNSINVNKAGSATVNQVSCQKGESDAGSGGRQVMNSSAPNGLKRHPIIGLIDEWILWLEETKIKIMKMKHQ